MRRDGEEWIWRKLVRASEGALVWGGQESGPEGRG